MIVSPRWDYVVKELFRDIEVLRYFISDILGIPLSRIRSLRLKNTFLWKRRKKEKQGILDVVAELNDDTVIDIELQAKVYDCWDKRQLFYLSKLYTEDLQTGQDYSYLRKCVGISILNFNLSDREKYHTVYWLMDEEGNKLSDILEVHVLELTKKPDEAGAVEDWIRFFNAETEEDLEMIKTSGVNMGILRAIGVLERLSMSNPLRLRFEAYLKSVRDERAWKMHVWKEATAAGMAAGRAEGMTIGKAEGMTIGKAEGMTIGKAEGMATGKAEDILYLLESRGDLPDDLRTAILSEKNMDKLHQWFIFAVESRSLEEFQKKAAIESDKSRSEF